MSTKLKKFSAVALVLTTMLWTMPSAQGATVEELQAQIASLLQQITSLQAQLTGSTSTPTSTACFTMTLKNGMENAEVKMLQEKLAMDPTVYPEGLTTGYFGPLTEGAVKKFQAKQGIVSSGTPSTTGYGLVGPKTRAKLNAMYCTSTTPVVTPTGTVVPTVAPVGTGLSVSMGPVVPAANIIADSTNGGQALVPFLKLNFLAGSDGEVKVTELKLTRSGISSNNDITNLYLFDGDTKVAEMRSITSDNVATFGNTAGLFTVPAGMMKTITVKGDVAKSTSSGKTFAFGVTNASFVSTSGATVSGTFPITGNQMTIASVSDLGKITFDNVTSNSAIDPDVSAERDLVRMRLTTANQKIRLDKLVLTMIGTAASGDFKDIKLKIGTDTYGPVQMNSDKTVVFDLSSNPYIGDSGQVKTINVTGKVIGGADRNFYLAIQNAGDIVAYDMNYNVYLPHNGSDTFSVVKPSSATTVNAGNLTVVRATDSPTGDVSLGGTNIEIGRFSFTASGEDIKVTSLTSTFTTTVSTSTVKNVKLYVNGSQVGTTDSSVIGNGSDTSSWGSFGNSFIVNAGETAVVAVRGDLTQTASQPATGSTVSVSLSAGSSNFQKQTSGGYGSTPAVTSNTLTVRSGTVSVAKNSAISNGSAANPSFVTGETNAKVGSFVVTAGLGEDVDITQLVIKDTAGTFPTYYANLKLVKNSDSMQIGSIYGTLTATANTTYSFVPSGNIRVSAGQQMIFDVYADIKTGLSAASAAAATVDAVYATGVNTSQTADYSTDVSLQSTYVAANGSITIAAGADTPIAQQVVSGKVYTFGTFKATAGIEEDVRLTQLVVNDTASASGADAADLSAYKLYDVTSGGKTLIAGPVYSVDTANATTNTGYVTFNGFNYTIPKNTSKDLAVEAQVVSWNSGQSANTHQLKVINNYNQTAGSNPVIAYGAKSNESLTATVSSATGNTMTVYRTIPSVTTNFTPQSGAQSTHEIGHFIVSNETNEGGYALTVEGLKVTINGTNLTESTSATTTRTFTLYKDTKVSGNKVAELVLKTSTTTTNTFNGVLDFATTSSGISSGFTGYTLVGGGTTTEFNSTEISSGGSKTFILVIDTTGPETTANNTSSVNVTLGADGLTWSDGEATGITVTNNLPMSTGAYNNATIQ